MISARAYSEAVDRAARLLERAGVAITPEERSRFEVADFGLGELEKTGLEIITYVNTERCCAKGNRDVSSSDLSRTLAPYD
jgi:D-lyxose ketol-isomerase